VAGRLGLAIRIVNQGIQSRPEALPRGRFPILLATGRRFTSTRRRSLTSGAATRQHLHRLVDPAPMPLACADQTADPDTEAALAARIEALVLEAAPIGRLFQPARLYVHHAVKVWQPTPRTTPMIGMFVQP